MRLKFWKKKEESIPQLGLETWQLGLERKPIQESYDKLGEGFQQVPPIESRPLIEPQPISQFSQNVDVQLVSAKLDTIKAMLDVINQRLTAIEKNVEEKQKQKLW